MGGRGQRPGSRRVQLPGVRWGGGCGHCSFVSWRWPEQGLRGGKEGGAPWLVSSGFLLDCKHSPVPGERQSWGKEGDTGWPGPRDAVGRTERRGLGMDGAAQFGVLVLLLPCTLPWDSLWHPGMGVRGLGSLCCPWKDLGSPSAR